jgi:prevent-host-death family protein
VRDLKQLSATEAARRFSELLDRVEQGGESYVVVRHGRAVATIGPAGGGTGKALKDALRVNRPDPAWAGELDELRESLGPVPDPWHD